MMLRVAVATLALCLSAGAAVGQQTETREEALKNEREAKSRQVQPYRPGKLESLMIYMQQKRLLERLSTGDGFYPRIGGFTTGSGFAPGVGYRHHLFEDVILVETSGGISTKGYKLAEGELTFPHLLRDRLVVGASGIYRYFPQEDFFGIGGSSTKTDRTNYLVESTEFMATAAFRPLPWMSAGATFGYLTLDVGPGTDRRVPSIEQLFTDAGAPGLDLQPDYRHTTLFFDIDRRDERRNARSGGHYRAAFANYRDLDLSRFSFNRADLEAAQFFPIFDKKRVIAVRARAIFTNNESGHVVPFYMLPTVGGSDTVRSFEEFRFRDENALILNLEYRWEAFSGLDMALFADAGKVSADYEDINLKRLKTGVGIGFRFNTYKRVFLRIDIGTGGREGTRLFFKFRPAF